MTDQTTTTIVTTTTRKIGLSGLDILQLLRKAGTITGTTHRVYIKVPTGGDYSGIDLDIADDMLVYVELVTVDRG